MTRIRARTSPPASPRWMPSRPCPSCANGTGCPAETSTARCGSSTSCPRNCTRCSPPGPCSTRSSSSALLKAVSSALETDKGLNLLSLAANVRGAVRGQGPLHHHPGGRDAHDHRRRGQPGERRRRSTSLRCRPSSTQVLGRPDPYATGHRRAPGTSVTVQVINGTGRPGLAASRSAALATLGFHVVAPANGSDPVGDDDHLPGR